MRIGIDAKWFFRGPVSTRVVLQNLLPALFTLFPEHQWIIFLDKKDKQFQFPYKSSNIKLKYLWADFNMLSNVFLMSAKLKSEGLDVIVYQTFPSLTQNVRTISFIHDVLFKEFPAYFTWKERLYFSPLSWLTRNRSDRLIATTEYVSNDLLKYNYITGKSHIDIVPLAVNQAYKPVENHDPEKLSAVKKKYQLPDRFLLFVGRLNVRKNVENLLKAIPLLQDSQIRLVIVGTPDWKTPDLKELMSNPDIKTRIVLTGGVTDEELILIYSMAAIFCFPSFAEGFGLPPLEAMASGVPVIVSTTTALPEVCGDAAVYINPYKPESIAQAVDSLLNNADLYQTQKQKGFDHVKKYTWGRTAKAFMNSINNAVKHQIE